MGTVDKNWDPAVLVFLVACLFIGWLVKAGVESRTISFDDSEIGISLRYPANWVTTQEEDALLAVLDPQTPSTFNTKLTLHSEKWNEELELGSFIMELAAARGASLPLYRTISMNPIQVDDRKGMKVEYAYAIDPIGAHAGVVSIPKIVRALDVIVPKADKAYIITFAAEEKEYDRYSPAFHAILESVRM